MEVLFWGRSGIKYFVVFPTEALRLRHSSRLMAILYLSPQAFKGLFVLIAQFIFAATVGPRLAIWRRKKAKP